MIAREKDLQYLDDKCTTLRDLYIEVIIYNKFKLPFSIIFGFQKILHNIENKYTEKCRHNIYADIS